MNQMTSGDPYDLQRFVTAQQDTYPQALAELQSGRKRSHWMWFVFPQISGLGSSHYAVFYAIGSLAEAAAYLAHPVLGSRLELTTLAVLDHPDRTLNQIFGAPDDTKFRSSMTLFNRVEGSDIYRQALQLFCDGIEDPATLSRL